MDESIHSGRKKIIIIIAISLIISLIVMALSFKSESVNPIKLTIRLSLSLILFYYLYQGSNVARIIAIICYILGGLVGIIAGLALLTQTIGSYLIISMGVFYLTSASILLCSKSIKEYINFKRLEKKEV